MKTYGAIRKIMLMVILSILGSYCIGSDDQDQGSMMSSFHSALQVVYNIAVSIGSYCHKLYSELAEKVCGKSTDEDVKIQFVDDNVHGNDAYCTDGMNDCIYNEDFFNDTYVTGVLDEDPTTYIDIDDPNMPLLARNFE